MMVAAVANATTIDRISPPTAIIWIIERFFRLRESAWTTSGSAAPSCSALLGRTWAIFIFQLLSANGPCVVAVYYLGQQVAATHSETFKRASARASAQDRY